MVDQADVLHGLVEDVEVADVALVKLKSRITAVQLEIVAPTAVKVVQDDHRLSAIAEQAVYQVAPDEASTTGDEDSLDVVLHGRSFAASWRHARF